MNTVQANLLKYLDDQNGFQVVGVQAGKDPGPLPEDLLWNLFDIVLKFGQLSRKGMGFRANFGTIGVFLEVHNFKGDPGGGVDGFFISKSSDGPFSSLQAISLLTLKNDVHLMWDTRFDLEILQQIVLRIDEFAIEEGYMVEGKRKMLTRLSKSEMN